MNEQRRLILAAGAALACGGGLPVKAETRTGATPDFDPMPPLPKVPSPGKPGDFGFLTGEWRIHNRSIVNGAWLEYPGEATVHAILEGVGSVEELRIPARNFSGMGLRLLEVESRTWSDFWVNARSGVLATPGQTGSFEAGVGIFVSDDVQDGKAVKYAGVWDRITPDSCRWRQGLTYDLGKSWSQNWIMDWRRV